MQRSTDPFTRIDSDSIASIIAHVAPLDIIVQQRVSRGWRALLGSAWIARHALVSHFPHSSETAEIRRRRRKGEEGRDGDADGEVVMGFRRCVYRYHTRRLGRPTAIGHLVLEPSLGVPEWGTTGDYVCWVSRVALHCQRISGGIETRRSTLFMDVVAKNNLAITEEDIAASMLRIQGGEEVVSVTLSLYDDIDDDDASGRRAFVLVFSLKDLEYLWHKAIEMPYKLLGEPDTVGDNFIYVRKKVVYELLPLEGEPEDAKAAAAATTVHLMVHDVRTGKKNREILLEHGEEITRGELFFIVVSDGSFKRLIVLFERDIMLEDARVEVTARLYSINDSTSTPGKLLAEYTICGNHSNLVPRGRHRQFHANSSVCVECPARLEKFAIVESLFVTACVTRDDKERAPADDDPSYLDEDAITDDVEADFLRLGRAMTGRLGLFVPLHLSPPVTPYCVFSITASKTGKLTLEPKRYLAELCLENDFFWDGKCYEPPPRALDATDTTKASCRRFEVFLPLEECSTIFSQRRSGRLTIHVAEYEPLDRDEYQQKWAHRTTGSSLPGKPWSASTELEASASFAECYSSTTPPSHLNQDTETIALMKQRSRHVLTSRRLTNTCTPPPPKANGAGGVIENVLENVVPYEIDPASGEILVKGTVSSHFLPHVQWSEKCITVRTNWMEIMPDSADPATAHLHTGDRWHMTGIVMFDFSPPW
ncbi:hypothetical protein BZA05DRAFT_393415 [Tricharina praecox]|uniref:uncharacterized protein n=1 Tax=Tricharina praecox TaxID=43433 RepID=UPI00221FCD28|nr:uncharacterized protein BZA05DRAFT_393415 [Tricharina praecox]KAI5854160.1 hypothetical protein BZA05DRAFT_393415 [Tricharina praecox]